jgi:phage I-like protein
MNPIKLSEFKKEIKQMNKEELIAALKACGVDVTSIMGAGETLTARVKELEAKIVELNALPVQKEAEIATLKTVIAEANKKIIENEMNRIFNGLVSEGKCVPAQKDAIFAAFKTAEEISAFYKNAPVVIATTPSGSGGEGEDETLTAEEKTLVDAGAYTKEEIIAGRSPVKKAATV